MGNKMEEGGSHVWSVKTQGEECTHSKGPALHGVSKPKLDEVGIHGGQAEWHKASEPIIG